MNNIILQLISLLKNSNLINNFVNYISLYRIWFIFLLRVGYENE